MADQMVEQNLNKTPADTIKKLAEDIEKESKSKKVDSSLEKQPETVSESSPPKPTSPGDVIPTLQEIITFLGTFPGHDPSIQAIGKLRGAIEKLK